ncbi:MAG: hypothetical protein RBT63_03185 [Bdellovibrionales bacterium]|nr:hypothetical protein [Bdellovibrionales bacterium]
MNEKNESKKNGSNKQFVDPSTSSRRGAAGYFETILRRFKTILHLVMLTLLYVLLCSVTGLAIVPGILLGRWILKHSESWSMFMSAWALGFAIVAAAILTAVALVIVLPTANAVLLWGGRLKEWRGPYYSIEVIRWYIHNGITYILRYTFLELFTPSPLSSLFYRLMGMKIGKGSIVNTTAISDPSLISIGRNVTIGGSVTIVGHYGQSGYLVLSPVLIGDGATIGLRASIMGGVKIGSNARIMPHSVVLPKTQIGEGETWGGVPAVRIQQDEAPTVG